MLIVQGRSRQIHEPAVPTRAYQGESTTTHAPPAPVGTSIAGPCGPRERRGIPRTRLEDGAARGAVSSQKCAKGARGAVRGVSDWRTA